MAVAITSSQQSSPFSVRTVRVTDIENTGLDDATGRGSRLYAIGCENDHGSASAPAFVKLYDKVNPTYGTDNPYIILRVKHGYRDCWTIAQGISFGSAVSLMCATTAGKSNSGLPAYPVNVNITST